MSAGWYKIFNLTEFLAEDLVSRTLKVNLVGRGDETFEIYRGNFTSVMYADAFMPIQFMGRNPYVLGNYAVYRDSSDNIWFGFNEG